MATSFFTASSHMRQSSSLVRVDSQVGAFSLYERLNADTALIHFEKGLPDCKGIYKEINAET